MLSMCQLIPVDSELSFGSLQQGLLFLIDMRSIEILAFP